MKESDHQNQDAPLSYRGARHIVGLVFLLVIAWFVLRSLQFVVLLFAIVFLLAMVLNPIVVWLQKYHVPRLASVILLMVTLLAVTGTIILFAIPPLARQSQELVQSAPKVWQGIRVRIESLTQNYPAVREALPRSDEIAGRVGAAAGTLGNILLRSTIGLVGGLVSAVFAVLLLIFVLAIRRRHRRANALQRHHVFEGERVLGGVRSLRLREYGDGENKTDGGENLHAFRFYFVIPSEVEKSLTSSDQ